MGGELLGGRGARSCQYTKLYYYRIVYFRPYFSDASQSTSPFRFTHENYRVPVLDPKLLLFAVFLSILMCYSMRQVAAALHSNAVR